MEKRSSNDVLKLVKDAGVEIVDARFCDLPGLMQHFSVPAHELTEDVFEDGLGFDGSSIRGFQEIQESDMLLIPDPNTAVLDPFRQHTTLNINAHVRDPLTGESYSRDPRYIVQKAEAYLKSTGLADTAYFGPEAEFYIFDSVRFDQNQFSGYYFLDSVEGVWNSGRERELDGSPNLAYKPRYKEGYFPVPPMDQFQDLRSEMVRQLEAVGISIEGPHQQSGTGPATKRPSTWCTRSATVPLRCASRCTRRARRRSGSSSVAPTRRATRTSRSRRCSWPASTASRTAPSRPRPSTVTSTTSRP